ncbi:hypothetical protein QBC33DRAFT_550283 [Phialemonium atrogriseum]|uniref:Protein kinase domain-containing protein n=1 Tax=Phialemonium atrogriseum TaxID=1093897 RepID=A0AAJ0BRR8_9PEZI|nr:uncharacterized protein QBC33DRAFT_550283 [Phialemonium atrogriseum]KAK1763280.1 hypothetical protein QBC33DRAFT_550283 [Phialemonium atrogriseum]
MSTTSRRRLSGIGTMPRMRHLATELNRQHTVETTVYRRLHAHQGRQIPQLYASVDVDMALPATATPWQRKNLFSIRGLLMEYIPGFTLANLVVSAPRSSWQEIVIQAVREVQILGDYEIANEDVRPENFLVAPPQECDNNNYNSNSSPGQSFHYPTGYRVVMIDFAMCRFREPDMTDLQWERLKCNLEEENAVGLLMKKKLANQGFELQYRESGRYSQFAEGEEEVEDGMVAFLRSGGRNKKREPLREMSV